MSRIRPVPGLQAAERRGEVLLRAPAAGCAGRARSRPGRCSRPGVVSQVQRVEAVGRHRLQPVICAGGPGVRVRADAGARLGRACRCAGTAGGRGDADDHDQRQHADHGHPDPRRAAASLARTGAAAAAGAAAATPASPAGSAGRRRRTSTRRRGPWPRPPGRVAGPAGGTSSGGSSAASAPASWPGVRQHRRRRGPASAWPGRSRRPGRRAPRPAPGAAAAGARR